MSNCFSIITQAIKEIPKIDGKMLNFTSHCPVSIINCAHRLRGLISHGQNGNGFSHVLKGVTSKKKTKSVVNSVYCK